MKCLKCGAEIPEEAIFCPDCGCTVTKKEENDSSIIKSTESITSKAEEKAVAEAQSLAEQIQTDAFNRKFAEEKERLKKEAEKKLF